MEISECIERGEALGEGQVGEIWWRWGGSNACLRTQTFGGVHLEKAGREGHGRRKGAVG